MTSVVTRLSKMIRITAALGALVALVSCAAGDRRLLWKANNLRAAGENSVVTSVGKDVRVYIELLPHGTSDGTLPTIWISTEKKQWEEAYQFNDVVDAVTYADIWAFISRQICPNQDGKRDWSVGSQKAIILRERTFSGETISFCRVDGNKVDKLVEGLSKIIGEKGVSSHALEIWSTFLRNRDNFR